MPIIDVSLSPGRSPEQLRALASGLTQATVNALGIEPSRVRVLMREVPDTHWATAGITTQEAKETGAH